MELHRFHDALPVLHEAQVIAEASLGPTHPIIGEVLSSYAQALDKTGERKQAHELERRSQAIFKLYPDRIATISLAELSARPRR
jgi:hypothetical protein